jgi:hypothetical protein
MEGLPGRIWKEVVLKYFRNPSIILPRQYMGDHKNLTDSVDRELKSEPPELNEGALNRQRFLSNVSSKINTLLSTAGSWNICMLNVDLLSSLAWTLGSWVRIPLKAWMSVYVYSVFVLSCVGSDLATGWSPVRRVLPTVLGLRNWSGTKYFTYALCSKVGSNRKREREMETYFRQRREFNIFQWDECIIARNLYEIIGCSPAKEQNITDIKSINKYVVNNVKVKWNQSIDVCKSVLLNFSRSLPKRLLCQEYTALFILWRTNDRYLTPFRKLLKLWHLAEEWW